jgi:hypothetical protein
MESAMRSMFHLPNRPLTCTNLAGPQQVHGHRYELLDGVLVVRPPRSQLHENVAVNLGRLLVAALPADFEVVVGPWPCTLSKSTQLCPDVVVAPYRSFTDYDLPCPPTLAVDIVISRDTRLLDLEVKRSLHESLGADHYWVIDWVADGVVDAQVPRLRAWARNHHLGRYVEMANVVGSSVFAVDNPAPLNVVPAALLRTPAALDEGP